jgi:hypothetical protein
VFGAPALGEDDPLLSFLSVQRFPKVFNNSGYLLSFNTDPEAGHQDRVLGQFPDSPRARPAHCFFRREYRQLVGVFVPKDLPALVPPSRRDTGSNPQGDRTSIGLARPQPFGRGSCRGRRRDAVALLAARTSVLRDRLATHESPHPASTRGRWPTRPRAGSR